MGGNGDAVFDGDGEDETYGQQVEDVETTMDELDDMSMVAFLRSGRRVLQLLEIKRCLPTAMPTGILPLLTIVGFGGAENIINGV